jgi:hypothetical protein
MSVKIADSSIFAGSGSSGVYISTDDGVTWRQSSLTDELIYALAVVDSTVFAGTYWSGVYRSTDFGVTWEQTDLNYQETHALHIMGDTIFAGTIYEGIYFSADNGETWEATSMWDKNVDALANIGNSLFAGTWDWGVYSSSDYGNNWSQLALNNHDVRAFINTGTSLLAASSINGIYESTDNGMNWSHKALEYLGVLAFYSLNDYLFAGTYGAGVYRSADNGNTWSPTSLNNMPVYSLAASGNTMFAGTFDFFSPKGIYKSTNNGTSWTQTSLNNRHVFALAVSGTTIYAGTFDLNVPYGIYKSTDNGATWSQTSLNDKNVYTIAINGTDIYAGTFDLFGVGSGIYRSSDEGQNWVQTSLTDMNIWSITVHDGKLYAGTDQGVFYSDDNGDSWAPLNTGFGSLPIVYSLFVNQDHLFAGTSSNSVWSYNLLIYLITATAEEGGTVDPSGIVVVNPGQNQAFTIQPDTGYFTLDVLVDGQSVGPVTTYEFVDVNENHTIEAQFDFLSYLITASATTGGSIDPDGSVVVIHGMNQSFTIEPDEGYQILDVLVDGQSVGAVNSYLFEDVTENHTIEAHFEPLTFLISATATPGGSINPAGDVVVNYGTNQLFTMQPDGGYEVSDVLVDGLSVGASSTYEFLNVADNHSIEARFSLITYIGGLTEGQLSLSPNPAADFVVINFNGSVSDEIDVILYDALGRPMFTEQFRDKISVDVRSLQAGVYILSLTTGIERINKKLIVE